MTGCLRRRRRRRRQGVRAADVEQIREDVQLDVDALDLPIELAQVVLGAEDGDAPDRVVGDAKSRLPDDGNVVARGGRRMLDYDGAVDAL